MIYETPEYLDNILITYENGYLVGLVFINDCVLEMSLNKEIFAETIKWLDIYFKGENPHFIPKYKLNNLTNFRREVLDILISIPYGETVSYNDIAKIMAKRRNIKRMSAQAVGQAVSKNPICIIIPCHRVIGSNKKLIGFTGGINNKIGLLNHELSFKRWINE